MEGILNHFESLTDPRIERCKLHPMENILFIILAAVLSGCENWDEIEDYGIMKQDWLSSFLDLSHGIPSHDTFDRFFSSLNPEEFERCFISWVQSISSNIPGESISINGKTICGANRGSGFDKVHIVSAWASENELVLGQIKTEAKSNEITVIPKLLELLLLEGRIITIDAMGCQKDIAEHIIEKGADYILALKDNHRKLKDDVFSSFSLRKPSTEYIEESFGHGRIETRKCSVATDLRFIESASQWIGLSSVVRIQSERIIKTTGVVEKETRFYLSSLSDAEVIGKAIRNHWGIENKLHWVLDVVMKEDDSAKRKGYAAQNYSLINKIALNLLSKNQKKVSIKRKRNLAGWDNEFLIQIMKN